MKDSKQRFSDRVENYIRYRPDYPPEIVLDLEDKDYLQKEAVIADIGSGTGKSTELFLARGYTCIGVEPNRAMREAAEGLLRAYEAFQSVNGSAESTGLEDESINFISAGQAFHWFDRIATKIEFKRILRPDGYVALIWNERHHKGSEFQSGYEALLKEYCNDYEKVDYKNVDDEAIRTFYAPSKYSLLEYSNSQKFDLNGLRGRLLSSSYCPLPDEFNYDPLMKELEDLFTSNQADGTITFEYFTRIYIGQLT